MKTKLLLPKGMKIWGWALFVLGSLLGIDYLFLDSYALGLLGSDWLEVTVVSFEISLNPTATKVFDFSIDENNIYDEILSLMVIIGGILVSFSRERDEDELTSKLRLESLVWAIVINYSVLTLATIFVYEDSFLNVMIYNMFTPLILFVIRFNWLLWKSRRSLAHEE